MNNEDFQKYLKYKNNKVFVFSCSAIFPFTFARHLWIVVTEKGAINRYELMHSKTIINKENKSTKNFKDSFIYINLYKPTEGIQLFPWTDKIKSRSRLEYELDLKEDITSESIIDFLTNYEFKDIYNLLGPNSNTFAKYLLTCLGLDNIKLPWNAFGKNYYGVGDY